MGGFSWGGGKEIWIRFGYKRIRSRHGRSSCTGREKGEKDELAREKQTGILLTSGSAGSSYVSGRV